MRESRTETLSDLSLWHLLGHRHSRTQTSAGMDNKSPDSSVSFFSGRTDETDRYLSQVTWQNIQSLGFQTADRHRTRFSGKSGQKPNKDRTWTGHGQFCPPTSDPNLNPDSKKLIFLDPTPTQYRNSLIGIENPKILGTQPSHGPLSVRSLSWYGKIAATFDHLITWIAATFENNPTKDRRLRSESTVRCLKRTFH